MLCAEDCEMDTRTCKWTCKYGLGLPSPCRFRGPTLSLTFLPFPHAALLAAVSEAKPGSEDSERTRDHRAGVREIFQQVLREVWKQLACKGNGSQGRALCLLLVSWRTQAKEVSLWEELGSLLGDEPTWIWHHQVINNQFYKDIVCTSCY